jgi:hypothetical protein
MGEALIPGKRRRKEARAFAEHPYEIPLETRTYDW